MLTRMCQGNLRASEFFEGRIGRARGLREFKPEIMPTMLVTNPPHGKRLRSTDSLIPL